MQNVVNGKQPVAVLHWCAGACCAGALVSRRAMRLLTATPLATAASRQQRAAVLAPCPPARPKRAHAYALSGHADNLSQRTMLSARIGREQINLS
eukprot:6205139-Pleurochrysis_carterae.AAC.1